MAGFKHVDAGGQISASDYNSVMDMARSWYGNRNKMTADGNVQFPSVKIKNESGIDLPAHAVIGIECVLHSPQKNEEEFRFHTTFTGKIPNLDHHIGRYGITQEPIPNGEIGRCVIDGVTVARLFVVNECHWFAEVQEGSTDYLTTDGYGSAIILYKECGLGEKWGVVRISYTDYGKACTVGGNSGTTLPPWMTTTTTTPIPQPCSGRCRYTWSAANKAWSLVTNECGLNPDYTTTTTTTTTGTPDPNAPTPTTKCCCCDPTTTLAPGSTTTSTTGDPATSTTTTPPPCNCVYPSFCGEVDGECTYTYCATGVYSNPPRCGRPTTTSTTSTSPDPATTTTTSRCNTTTTTGDPCGGGCRFKWTATSEDGWHWVKFVDTCSWGCPCQYPSRSGTHPCDEEATICVRPPNTTLPPGTYGCQGWCDFWWAFEYGDWLLNKKTCNTDRWWEPCICVPPSEPGNICGSRVRLNCLPVTTTSTTTPDPCYTTIPPDWTTTTPKPCEGGCKWAWNGTSWSKTTDQCLMACPCPEPDTEGHDTCETTWTWCRPILTTTTTQQPPTTQQPTTTTTPIPCSGSASWVWNSSIMQWQITRWDCAPYGCNTACDPAYPIDTMGTEGQTIQTDCACRTTTTPPPCGGNCRWQWVDWAGNWFNIGLPCPYTCAGCALPQFTGYPGQEVETPCVSNTTPNPCGGCVWTCSSPMGNGIYEWHKTAGECLSPCFGCPPPNAPCAATNSGQQVGTACATTTTTLPPGSTTTTSTTTTTPCPYGYTQWICLYYDGGLRWTIQGDQCSNGGYWDYTMGYQGSDICDFNHQHAISIACCRTTTTINPGTTTTASGGTTTTASTGTTQPPSSTTTTTVSPGTTSPPSSTTTTTTTTSHP